MLTQNETLKILAKFPSYSWLSRKLGLKEQVAANWGRRKPYRIPSSYMAEILELAQENEIELTADELIQSARRQKEEA